MKKWRDLFATKKISKNGTRVADVHLYEPPQDTQTPCRICNMQEVEDVRDRIIGELSPTAEMPKCLENEEGELSRNPLLPIDPYNAVEGNWKCLECNAEYDL